MISFLYFKGLFHLLCFSCPRNRDREPITGGLERQSLISKQDVRRSRGDGGSAQARRSASNNKKQKPGNMADLGKKYCVNCLADVTNLRLRCTDCPDIELCPECFSAGAEIGNHRRWHGYQQVDGGRFSLWGPEAEGGWTSREEQSLLDAIEQYGFGNWVRLK